MENFILGKLRKKKKLALGKKSDYTNPYITNLYISKKDTKSDGEYSEIENLHPGKKRDGSMSFIGRERELRALDKMYKKDNFQMMVLYGRRRIGKTTLLNEFSMGKEPLFYTGIESKDRENLREFGNAVFHYAGSETTAEFRGFSEAVRYLTSFMKRTDQKKRHLIIIDEYPYMA